MQPGEDGFQGRRRPDGSSRAREAVVLQSAQAVTPIAAVEPSYAIDLDRRKGVMRIILRGFWDVQTVEAFYAAAMAATQDMRRTNSCHDTIIDAREFSVQSLHITDGIAGLMRMGMDVNDGWSAVISKNHLGKMQGDRLNPNPKLKLFLNEADALAWIAERQSPAIT